MTTVRHPAPGAPTRRLGVGRALHGLLRVTEWVVLGVAVVACVVFSVGTLTGRLLLQTVPTGSMEPVIPKGSAIMVEHQDVSTIQVGDVIVFAAPETGTMTVHRVIEIGEIGGERTFTTKGDNNPGPDPWNLQLSGQKVHKVTTVLPLLGTVLTDAGTPRVRIALMVVGGLLVLVAGFFAIWRRDERRREERRKEERRRGDRRQPQPEAAAWPLHLERRVGERRVADRRLGDRREADRRHDDQRRRDSGTRALHDRTTERDPERRAHSSVHALRKTLGTTVAAIAVITLIPTTVAHASFTGSETAQSTVGTGSLAVPTDINCRWTSATAVSLNWTLAAGIQTNTQALQQTTSTGAITVAATVAAGTTAASVSPTPVTTPRYLSARTTKGTWTSAQSDKITTDRCAGAVVTFAGNGSQAFTGDGGAATSAALNAPNMTAEAPDGSVFIADTGNNRIRKVATDGTITTVAGGGASTACTYSGAATGLSLNAPQGVAVDASGNLYVADTGNNCIRKIDGSGAVSRVAGGGATSTCTNATVAASALSLSGPAGIALDPNGDVIVADTGRNCIRRISGTNATRVAGGGATTTCSATATAASNLSLSAPQGVAVAANGDVIVADTGRNCVRRISGTNATLVAGGGATTSCTSATTPSGVSLSAPEAVAVAANGDVIVADTGRRCVRRATATAVTQVAFTGSTGTAGDNGPAIGATVRSPAGLTVTATGDLLVSDRATNTGANDVRRVRTI